MEELKTNQTLIDPKVVERKGKDNQIEGSQLDEPKHNDVDPQHVSKKVHQFYFVKFWPYQDPKLKAKIQGAENLVNRLGQEKIQIYQNFTNRMSVRKWANFNLEDLRHRYRSCGGEYQREKMIHLKLALDKLCFTNSAYQGRPINLCFSGDEFDKHKLQFRIVHKTKSLAEEKQLLSEIKANQRATNINNAPFSLKELEHKISCSRWRLNYNKVNATNKTLLREIKELELTREKAIADAAVKGKIWNSLGSKHDLQDQVKLVSSELDQLRENQLEIRAKIKREFGIETIEKDISCLKQKLLDVDRRKEKAHQCILNLTKQLSEENVCYDQYVALLKNAEVLAEIKDVTALEELSHREVEKFMSEWNTSKTFGDDYEKRLLSSIDKRQLSRDGRMRNPGEKLLSAPLGDVEPERPLRRRIKWQSKSRLIKDQEHSELVSLQRRNL